MSFYNTYRPHHWGEVLGQEQVISILKSQALTGQFAHSYLFFGASGSGKTTCARILASCLNCANLDGTGEPCGVCDNCRLTLEGSHWDVIEVDSGRFRGIEDIKDLCYKAHFSPINNKKVYILDEAHQITEAGFNAMLKLLEEPPPHLVIILCTTQFEKIPDTISSRCQLYPFIKLKPEDIRKKLELISKKEGITPDTRHLEFITQSSAGNMRSAENLLEQCMTIAKPQGR